jgi:bifunctional non-homologous end joining protein LigD
VSEGKDKVTVKVGRRSIPISSPDKLLFPDVGVTKIDLAKHYAKVGKLAIPHMKDRPLTLHVFPAGLKQDGIYIKKVPFHFPEWIDRHDIEKREGGTTKMAVANEPGTLVFLAGQNCITPHIWPAKVDDLEHPDRLIFDFDPPEGSDFADVREAAKATGEILRELGLSPYVMTSGSRGMHVIAPVRRDLDWKGARAFAHAVGDRVAETNPDKLTMEHRIAKRGGRIYVDTTRNAYGQHGVAPYAVRAKPAAPVATPLEWSELDDPGLTSQSWTIKTIGERIDAGDPWKGIGRAARSLKKAAGKLGVEAAAA